MRFPTTPPDSSSAAYIAGPDVPHRVTGPALFLRKGVMPMYQEYHYPLISGWLGGLRGSP